MEAQLALTFESMTDEEALVWSFLKDYVGKKSAINQRDLAYLTCLPERTVRNAISSLIVNHRKSICSSYESKKGGYFLPANDAEVQETCGVLHKHALRMLMRESVLRNISIQNLMEKYQRELPFEEAIIDA